MMGGNAGANNLVVSASRLDAVVTLAELGEEGPEDVTHPGTVTFNATAVAGSES